MEAVPDARGEVSTCARERDFEQHKAALLAELDRQIATLQEQQVAHAAACRATPQWRRWLGSLVDGWRYWRWRFGEWRARP